MKARPILFSSEMVRAILDGRKTQTRRVINGINHLPGVEYSGWCFPDRYHFTNTFLDWYRRCPYGQPGDRLWVRETWRLTGDDKHVCYRADDWHEVEKIFQFKWKPGIYMPRWASRITLEIVKVRVERIQDISEKDAEAEGIHLLGLPINERHNHPRKHISAYKEIWNLINAKRGYGWDTNPWVWVIEFRKDVA